MLARLPTLVGWRSLGRTTAAASTSPSFATSFRSISTRPSAACFRPSAVKSRPPRHVASPTSKTQRRAYHDSNDPRIRNARPLFSREAPGRILRSPGTHAVAVAAVVGAFVFYFSNLETVPISGRTRFNCYSYDTVRQTGEAQYKQVLYEVQRQGGRVLPDWDPRTQRVKRVMRKLIPFSGMVDENWEIFVIDDPKTQNAFVLPGGKVFVFSGILQLTRNDSGLAAVLGHEIAHNLANHVGERMSSDLGTNFLMWPMIILTAPFGGLPLLMQLFGWGALDLAFGRPMNRRQETEADYIGLMMMAEACYDPREAASFWARMEKAHQMEPPEWLSTHPSNENRIQKMQEWLPKALDKASESDCSTTTAFADVFRRALEKGFIIEV